MSNLNQARAHLALVDRYIREIEEQIDKQIAKNAESEAAGSDTGRGYRFLALLVESLELMQPHKRKMLDALYEKEARTGKFAQCGACMGTVIEGGRANQ